MYMLVMIVLFRFAANKGKWRFYFDIHHQGGIACIVSLEVEENSLRILIGRLIAVSQFALL